MSSNRLSTCSSAMPVPGSLTSNSTSVVAPLPGCLSLTRQATAIVESGKARFTVIAPECIRIEYSGTGEFVVAHGLGLALAGRC